MARSKLLSSGISSSDEQGAAFGRRGARAAALGRARSLRGRGSADARGDEKGARTAATLDDECAADGQQRHGWLCSSIFRSKRIRDSLACDAKNNGWFGRQAARAGNRGA